MRNTKSGQIALIILLLMVVILTVGLSLISHSVTDISISKDEEEAMRAFSAAEAGIEEALKDIADYPSTIEVGEVTANISVTPSSNNIVRELAEGESMNIDLEGATGTGGPLTIDWTDNTALEIVIYGNGVVNYREAIKTTGFSGCADNNFDGYDHSFTTPSLSPGSDLLVRINVLCNPTTLTITSDSGLALPTQEYQIDSRAAAGGTAESKTSAIEVTRTVPEIPSIFDYVLFSKGDLQ